MVVSDGEKERSRKLLEIMTEKANGYADIKNIYTLK